MGLFSEFHHHLHGFDYVEFQVVATAPGHQSVSLTSVLGPIAVGDETDHGGVISKLELFDRCIVGGAVIGVE